MKRFVFYIELLDEFRQFRCSLNPHRNRLATYQSYSQAQQEIIEPVVEKLLEIEQEIRMQG